MGLNVDQGACYFLDTAPLIYFFEEHEKYCPVLERIFDRVYEAQGRFVCSLITYIEVLTLPEREGDYRLVQRYREFFTNTESLSIYPLSISVADRAIQIRAEYSFRTPDAINLATADCCGVDGILSNDKTWKAFSHVPVTLIDDLV